MSRPLLALLLAAAASGGACSNQSSPPAGGSAAPAGEATGSGRTVAPMRPPVRAGGGDVTAVAPEPSDDAGADDAGAGDGDRKRGYRERMAQFDTDGDGSLSDEERYTMLAARAASALHRMDTDGNGQLSRAEFEASPGARRVGDFAAADADGSGALSSQELGAAMVAQMKKAGGFRAWRGPRSAGGAANPATDPNDGSE